MPDVTRTSVMAGLIGLEFCLGFAVESRLVWRRPVGLCERTDEGHYYYYEIMLRRDLYAIPHPAVAPITAAASVWSTKSTCVVRCAQVCMAPWPKLRGVGDRRRGVFTGKALCGRRT